MKKITLILSSALLIALIALSAVPSSFAADNERPFDWTKISTSLYEGLHEYGATNSITVDGPSGEIYYFGQGYTSSDGTFPTVLKFNTNTGIWTDIIAGSNNPFSNEARAIYSAVKIPNTNNVLVGLTLNNEGAQLWRLDMSNDTWTSDARYTPDDDHDIIPSIAISSTGKECMLAPQNFSTPAVFCAPDADTNFTALNMSGPGTFDLSYANVNLPVITFLGEDPIISTYESGEGTVYPSIWRYFTDDEEWFQIT